MSRTPGRSNPLPLVVAAVGLSVFLGAILAYASGRQPAEPRSPTDGDQSAPSPVHERVVTALRQNDIEQLYAEMSPSLTAALSLGDLQAAEQAIVDAQGAITGVDILEPPKIRTEPGWDGEWADAQVRIRRGAEVQTYVVRYVLEDSKWYLFGTVELP